MRALFFIALAGVLRAGTGADLIKSINMAGLDASECYRVRDLSIARDEAQIFFTDGYLIFGKPVGSARVTAVFSAEVEGGDGELLLLPPTHAERRALAKHTGSPNLEEHFTGGVFVFSDNTYAEIMQQIAANPYMRKVPEMGALLADKWQPVVRNVSGSFSLRLAMDLLSQDGSPAAARKNFFGAALSGKHLGAFDVIYEARNKEQLLAGQSGPSGFDLWTSFTSRSFRNKAFQPEYKISEYHIETTISTDLTLHCVTHLKLQPRANERALPFEISHKMRVTSATIDGQPAELLSVEEPRGSLSGTSESVLFVVAPAKALEAGKVYDVEIQHEGNVVSSAGNRVYYVGSRGNWYPGRGMQASRFDLTFHYPKDLMLVSTGEPVDDRLDGEQRITHRVTNSAVRLAGFNLGIYDTVRLKRGELTIEVCANRSAEQALVPKAQPDTWSPINGPGVRRPRSTVVAHPAPILPPVPNTTAHLQSLAADIGDVMAFYTARFGPAPTRTLEVTPVPGRFGQGFPGLIYLSTLSYLEKQEAFFSDLLHAHEAAHQWWGNIVTSAGYHDDWLMEALANYSALLYLEKKKGAHARDIFLDEYRTRLLVKGADGKTVESAGPVVQGTRVDGNWNAVVYGKGTWILHMLRRKMGDEAFLKMLGALRHNYEDQSISTDEFRLFCAGFLPAKSEDPKLEAFFDQWVYGTGIPTLKLEYRISGGRVSGAVKQSGVDEDFTADVPVEIQQGRVKPMTVMVRASGDTTPFTAAVKGVPAKVSIDMHGVLAR